ncbi:hypothetical protein ACIPY6_28800 [Streptomyces sp. NPDC090054]|uniref:hypothetical protein n=1 Tax=Streptomyces sp. NPDC090054 TaxID=3365933 RepID=UPI0038285ECB
MGVPPEAPPGAYSIVLPELPLPLSAQTPPELPPIPEPADPDPGDTTTLTV